MKIYNLNEIPEDIWPTVGGKARGLCQLSQFGFNIPKGFILVDVSSDKDINAAYEYCKAQGLKNVAVRSSATLEDGDDFSSAGQFSTYLNIHTKMAFVKAVKDCIASLNSETARSYSKTFLKNGESKMTVVVQEMVNAKTAGVIFSKDPNAEDATLVEAVPGLGEGLVSGALAAEQYSVKDKSFARNEKKLLTDEQVLFLADSALKIEEKFGKPMDMEWAMDQKGEIYFLQARPITVNEEVTINELDCDIDTSKDVMTTDNIKEVLPGAVTPLTLTTSIWGLDYGTRKIMQKNGCVKKVEDLPPYSCLCNYYNHMFFSLSTLYRIIHSCYFATKDALEISICGRPLPDMPDVDVKNTFVLKRVANTGKFLKYAMSCKGAIKGMDAVIEKIDHAWDLTKSAAEIYDQCEKNFDLMNEAMFYHYWTSWYSGSQSNMFITMKQKDFSSREELQAKMAGALTNIDNIESAQIIIGMKELSEVLKKNHPDITKLSSEELANFLTTVGGEDKEALDKFMKRHGHRGIKEMEMRSLPWKKDIKAFANSLYSVLNGKEIVDGDKKSWQEYAEEIVAKDKGQMKKVYKNMIVSARKGVYYREYTKSRCIYVVDKFKTAYAKIAELLVKDDILPDADLIYFLTKDEIGELIRGKSSLIKKAIARRRIYPEQCALKFNEIFIGKPTPVQVEAVDASITSYSGTPVSRGIITGKARVVRSVEDANKLEQGEIMVAEFTDIGWSPYYYTIGGLVTEIGSSLSHGVVVAREYSLPTIVNVNNAMEIIHTGDTIKIDGNTGKIDILERA